MKPITKRLLESAGRSKKYTRESRIGMAQTYKYFRAINMRETVLKLLLGAVPKDELD